MNKYLSIVEVPIPDQDPISKLYGTGISIRLDLNFDNVGIEFRLGQNQQCLDTCLGFEC